MILLVVLRWKGGREAFAGAGLAGGKARIWLLYGTGQMAFYGLQAFLNYVFKSGQVVDLKAAFPPRVAANLPASAILLMMALPMLIICPSLGPIISFGEEYGWRGYLHALNNQALKFFVMTMVMPTSMFLHLEWAFPAWCLVPLLACSSCGTPF